MVKAGAHKARIGPEGRKKAVTFIVLKYTKSCLISPHFHPPKSRNKPTSRSTGDYSGNLTSVITGFREENESVFLIAPKIPSLISWRRKKERTGHCDWKLEDWMQLPLRDRRWRFSLRASAHGGFRLRFNFSSATKSILGKCKPKFSFLIRLPYSLVNIRLNLSLPSKPPSLRRLFCRSRSRHSIDPLLGEMFAVLSGIGSKGGGMMMRSVGVFGIVVLTALMFRNTWAILGMAKGCVTYCAQKSWK